ncbi:thiamine pyrophosphate-dependent enzyme [Thermosediminibacter litoriperuensis]|uniref:2-oxoglutarate ferredoxin oxidoreductase subunit beta n=1 Tax=Thermosediminibacter litoriperuensis TaxID=291989 RepID=A0A5S5AZX5_9FIRM|nr:thiamine pyrophosphate-dependent enzyme [Thermosediminibacter litoriperuensis]TYP59858.1 2-oxoglutarate ferredoxin oxidoreductase subunit beta [Thermosediminibacter litoriperuensis]
MGRTIFDYIIEERLPFFWCEGCGNGIIIKAIAQAFADLDLDPKKIVIVTGIGCWGKADDYLATNSLHVTHGRALAAATGVKAANPELKVLALMGDGDGITIGGNHFIHAARRNMDITAIISNNFNYGMTGGQYSGTTPEASVTSTSRYGAVETPFDVCRLAQAAGAPYVARATVYHVNLLEKYITTAIAKKGFSVVDVINVCPTYYGRLNRMKSAVEMMEWLKISSTTNLSEGNIAENRFAIGEFVNEDRPDFTEKYREIQRIAREDMTKLEEDLGGR